MYSYKIYHLHLTAEGYLTKSSFLIGLALKGNFWIQNKLRKLHENAERMHNYWRRLEYFSWKIHVIKLWHTGVLVRDWPLFPGPNPFGSEWQKAKPLSDGRGQPVMFNFFSSFCFQMQIKHITNENSDCKWIPQLKGIYIKIYRIEVMVDTPTSLQTIIHFLINFCQ